MRSRTAYVVLSLVSILAAATTSGSLAAPQKETGSEQDQELKQIGMALKAAVRTGALSGEDARAVWGSLIAELEEPKLDAYPNSEKREVTLRIGWTPIEVREILQPEFVRRDLVLIRDELDIDASQLTVIESLLEDYMDLFDFASQPLRDALGRYRRAQRDQRVSRALEKTDIGDVSDLVSRALRDYGRKREEENWSGKRGEDRSYSERRRDRRASQKQRAEFQAYSDKVMGAMETMETRLTALRIDVRERLSETSLAGEHVTAQDLVRLADAFEDERMRLRTEFSDYLALIANAERAEVEQERFEAALARLSIEHGLVGGGLGGESINLRAALAESALDLDQEEAVRRLIEERQPVLAQLIEQRLELKIEREIASMDLLAKYDRAIEAGADRDNALGPNDMRPFINICLNELDVSVAVRDELLMQLKVATSLLFEDDEEGAAEFRDAGLRYGFRDEMKQSWSERALDMAMGFEELDDQILAALEEIRFAVEVDTRALREEAISDRIKGDPKRTRAWLEGIVDDYKSGGKGSKKDEWDEASLLRYEDILAVDDWTEGHLFSLLTPEQLEALPARRKEGDKDTKNSKSESKDSGKGAK